ncbi:hypothetical protein CHL67_02525 [Prosthecochloris sp. GSB1]|uniref:glycosyltransferase family 2 protein n=1 Tax=Prosthecochloris sp. GSB1 TaxID=281093 RepID=UPI000B8D14AE|nr:glycosyltransferase family 2 protein [Prosthecochloris sp. GSB1]ASQ89943.1 hypothetical protein CHL67_02525 [Prosthecochloris sp. GSB1]
MLVQGMVSIVMPVYNGSKYLDQSIASVLRQDYGDFELVCVDDGSTDRSLEVLREYESRDRRIKVYTKPNGGSVSRVLNFVLPRLEGQYFYYMSQDDMLSVDLLGTMVARSLETGADAVVPGMIYRYEDRTDESGAPELSMDRNEVISGREAVRLSIDGAIHGFILWRMTLVRTHGFEEFAMNADEYSVRVFLFSCRKVAFSGGCFYYHQHEGSITRKLSARIFDIPYTDYRLYDFVRNHDFDADYVGSVLEGAIIRLMNYQIKYVRNRSALGEKEKREIVSRLRKAYGSHVKNRIVRRFASRYRATGNLKYPLFMICFAVDDYRYFSFFMDLLARLLRMRKIEVLA